MKVLAGKYTAKESGYFSGLVKVLKIKEVILLCLA